MKKQEELTPVATVLKTHGVRGEVNCETDIDSEDFASLRCLFVQLDGLMVPFFIRSARPRGPYGVLVTFEGIDSDSRASVFTGHTLYAEKDMIEDEDDTEDGGFYLNDMIGWEVFADGERLGLLEDVDDSTVNVLMLVRGDKGELIHIPAADEFFTAVEPDRRTIRLDLPEGLVNLNKK